MFDANETFQAAEAGFDLAQVVGTYLFDKSVDMWNGARQTTPRGNTPVLDWGRGNPIEVVCQVTEAFVGATATVLLELVMADDEALGTNLVSLQQAPGGSITVGIPVATLVAGYQFRISAIPVGASSRYLGIKARIFTATTTAGKIFAHLAQKGGRSTAPGTMS